MRLVNTSRVDTREVKVLFKFARDFVGGLKTTGRIGELRVRNRSRGSGSGRAGKVEFKGELTSFVFASIGPDSAFPITGRYVGRGDRFPLIERRNYREQLVHLFVHELTHVVQCHEHRRFSELECELAAERALQEYREKESVILGSIPPEKTEVTSPDPKGRARKKLQKVQNMLHKWRRKAKLAATKIKKLIKKEKYYTKQVEGETEINERID